MTAKQKARQEMLRRALFPLVHDPRFAEFMNVVREQRDVAIQDAVSDRVVASERMLSVALGEVRCYENLLSLYEGYLNASENEVDEQSVAQL